MKSNIIIRAAADGTTDNSWPFRSCIANFMNQRINMMIINYHEAIHDDIPDYSLAWPDFSFYIWMGPRLNIKGIS